MGNHDIPYNEIISGIAKLQRELQELLERSQRQAGGSVEAAMNSSANDAGVTSGQGLKGVQRIYATALLLNEVQFMSDPGDLSSLPIQDGKWWHQRGLDIKGADDARALEIFVHAVELGHMGSLIDIGEMVRDGRGVEYEDGALASLAFKFAVEARVAGAASHLEALPVKDRLVPVGPEFKRAGGFAARPETTNQNRPVFGVVREDGTIVPTR